MFAQINHMAMISPHLRDAGQILRSRLRAEDLDQPAPRASRHRRRRLCRPQHHPAPRRLCRRHRSFRHAGRRRRARARAHAEEAPARQRREAPLRAPLRAVLSGHDPDGNVFDLAQKKNEARKDIYADIASQGWAQDRYLNKFAIRTPNAEALRRILSRRVRARAGEPQRASARLSPDRRPRDALDHAVVDPGLRGHVDQAPRPRPHRLPRRRPRRLQGRMPPRSAA